MAIQTALEILESTMPGAGMSVCRQEISSMVEAYAR